MRSVNDNMRSFRLNTGSGNSLLIRLICFFWLIAKGISWKLWLADRLFPIVPSFEFLIAPSFVHLVLFILSLIAILALFVFPLNKAIQISVIIIEILSCLLDQNRWQPWEYQYFFMILVFIINKKKERNIPAVIGFMIASIYIYSGISKMNPVFLQSVWYRIVLTQLLHVNFNTAHQLFIYHAGYLLGLIEIALGIGLFFQRTKKIAAILSIFMHVLILLIFGPLGINYDTIIWPWNVAMIAFLLVLIFQNTNFTISFYALRYGWNKLILLLFGIMPILNLSGHWDYFFSSSLFSARPPDMYICIKNNPGIKELKPFCLPSKNALVCDSNSSLINVRGWAFQEMLAPGNPQMRVYKSIKEQLQKRYPQMNATFITFSYINGKKVIEESK